MKIYKTLLISSTLFVALSSSAATVKKDSFLNERATLNSPKILVDGVNIGYLRRGETIEVIDVVSTQDGIWYETWRGFVRKRFLDYTPDRVTTNKTSQKKYITQENATPIVEPIIRVVEVVIPIKTLKDETITVVVNEDKTTQDIQKEKPVMSSMAVLAVKAEPKIETSKNNEVITKDIKSVTLNDTTQERVKKVILYKYFVGAGVNYNLLNVSKNDIVGDIVLDGTLDDNAFSAEFQVGIQRNKYIVTANYEYVFADNINMHNFYLSADYEFDIMLHPFIGISVGVANLNWTTDPLGSSQSDDTELSSYMYGLQAGASYNITKNWDIYTKLKYQKFDFITELISTPAKSEILFDAKTSIGLGVRYFF